MHHARDRAAVLYTLIGTARLNGLDPEAYLAHVIGRPARVVRGGTTTAASGWRSATPA